MKSKWASPNCKVYNRPAVKMMLTECIPTRMPVGMDMSGLPSGSKDDGGGECEVNMATMPGQDVIKGVLRQNCFYLMVVNMPSEEQLARARVSWRVRGNSWRNRTGIVHRGRISADQLNSSLVDTAIRLRSNLLLFSSLVIEGHPIVLDVKPKSSPAKDGDCRAWRASRKKLRCISMSICLHICKIASPLPRLQPICLFAHTSGISRRSLVEIPSS